MKINDLLDDDAIDHAGCLRYLTKICGSEVAEGTATQDRFTAEVTDSQFSSGVDMLFRTEGRPQIIRRDRAVQYAWPINGGTLTFDHTAIAHYTITISVKKP